MWKKFLELSFILFIAKIDDIAKSHMNFYINSRNRVANISMLNLNHPFCSFILICRNVELIHRYSLSSACRHANRRFILSKATKYATIDFPRSPGSCCFHDWWRELGFYLSSLVREFANANTVVKCAKHVNFTSKKKSCYLLFAAVECIFSFFLGHRGRLKWNKQELERTNLCANVIQPRVN